ncbi:helix-turn-helix domain-containing protein [Brevibacterium salitolerans]|uniref:HTH tetR-type domain-containing protein n=1 Tax=Brevibacterium salitolerans TaxID=1403566 RepID=A0ABP5HZM9_9MICO
MNEQTAAEETPRAHECESLRARKARISREAIHSAAVRLAYERGLEAATIAQISAEAGISQRTFFNYFASKEDAIIGTAVSGPEPEVVADAVAAADLSGDVFGGVAGIVRDVMSYSMGDDEVREMRRILFVQNPLLVQRKSDTGSLLATQLIDVLTETLGERVAELDLPEGVSTRDAVRMIVLISFAPLRSAYAMGAYEQRMREEAAGPESAPPPDTTPEAARARFDQSLALFRTVLEGFRS